MGIIVHNKTASHNTIYACGSGLDSSLGGGTWTLADGAEGGDFGHTGFACLSHARYWSSRPPRVCC